MNRRAFWLMSLLVVILSGCELPVYKEASPEPAILLTPLPDYLLVYPEPASDCTVAEYEALAPSLGWGATLPAVCAVISPENFLEAGDFPETAGEWLGQVHLVVDDVAITEYHSLFLTNSEGITMVDRETGELIWKEPPGSPLRVCYAVSLGKGLHIATLVVEKTSGEQVTHTWQFRIAE